MKINTIDGEKTNDAVVVELKSKIKGNDRFSMLYFSTPKDLKHMLDWIAKDFHYKTWKTKNYITLDKPSNKDGSNFTFEDIQHFSYDNIEILSVQIYDTKGDPIEDSFAFLYSVQKYVTEQKLKLLVAENI